MPWRARSELRAFAVVTVSACLIVGVVIVLIVAPPTALNSISARVGLISALLALPPAIAGLIKIGLDTSRVSPLPSPEDLHKAQEILVGQVRQKWRRDHADRWLNKPKSMPVRWSFVEPNVIESEGISTRARTMISGRSDQIAPLARKFRELGPRRLVILGGPGSGKTTLAIQLLLELLTPLQPGEPIPVLMSLSGWDTRLHPRLHDWLAARLAEMYPALREGTFSSRLPEELAKQSMILPVLDGLDELAAEARTEVILALNQSLTEADQLILTSRSTEYEVAIERAGQVLNKAVAIESRPLNPSDIAQYVEACLRQVPNVSQSRQEVGVSWRVVLAALRRGKVSPLLSVASKPIGLWLLRAVYIEARPELRPDPRSLLDVSLYPDEAAMQTHLFDKLIPALIASHEPSHDADDLFRPRHKWEPQKVRQWLGYLASCLTERETPDLSWWNLTSYALTTAQVLISFGAVCILALALIVVFGSSGGVVTKIHGSLAFGIIGGLLVGGGSGAALWLAFADSGARWLDYDNPAPVEEWLRRLLHRHFIGGLAAGLLFGLVAGPLVGLIEGLVAGFTFGVVSGVTFGVAGGLTFGMVGEVAFRAASWAERKSAASTPQSTFYNDRKLALWSTLIVAVTYALTFGIAVGLAFGLANLLAGGLAGRDSHAWAIYTIASIRLAAGAKLPVRLMAFLDDAHRVGLLRTVGPRYQFRHDELRSHLADAYNATPRA